MPEVDVRALLTAWRPLWSRFRRSKAFLPSAIVIPLLVVSGSGAAGYAAWDTTRVDVPDVVGEPLPVGSAALEALALTLEEPQLPDSSIAASCYVITAQSVPAGTRVVSDDTLIAVEVEPTKRVVPNLVGMPLADAAQDLQANCLHAETLATWCLPGDFSGPPESLESEALTAETGFAFDPIAHRLTGAAAVSTDSWVVCDQRTSRQSRVDAGSTVRLTLTAPLTTVPEIASPTLDDVFGALAETADGCTLGTRIVPTFPSDPGALEGLSTPATSTMSGWAVGSLSPAVGHALLCDSVVRVEVVWPAATMPRLIGLTHLPDAGTETAAAAALSAVGLNAACMGRGTVTRQSPDAGAAVPVGARATCVAELVVPSIIGLDPSAAASAFAAAGVPGSCTGVGVVVSQSPAAGTVLTGNDRASCEARAPQIVPFSGSAYYKNCTEARAAGAAPLYRGDPGYRIGLDRDHDGIACE